MLPCDDALAVRRFARARRRAGETALSPETASPVAVAANVAATLAPPDADRQEIAPLFAQALVQTTDPDLLARGRRVALNFADTVAKRWRDMALHDRDGPQ